MEILTVIILAISLVAISFLGFGINILFKKDGKFPQTSIGKNKKMRDLGLMCPKSEEIKCRRDIENASICSVCAEL